VSQSADCRLFRRSIVHFQADELPAAERQRLQDHLDRCADCARRLEVEEGFLRGLKARLRSDVAPPGLETRIRAALAEERSAGRTRMRWFRAPGFAAAAAALLLALLLIPGLGSPPPTTPVTTHEQAVAVSRTVRLVDLDCDRAGRTLDQQRRCEHPLHVNALRLADGGYWLIHAEQLVYRELMFDREMRGHRLEIEGDLHAPLKTLQIRRARDLGLDSL
jgi:hypothetical protein